RRFMPLDPTTLETAAAGGPAADYEFEPNPNQILERLLPRYAEARLFAALLDASASEHAARQRAMKSATDNAEELITKLSRVMNRARQDSSTTEIMESIAGAESLVHSDAGPEPTPSDVIVALEHFHQPFSPAPPSWPRRPHPRDDGPQPRPRHPGAGRRQRARPRVQRHRPTARRRVDW